MWGAKREDSAHAFGTAFSGIEIDGGLGESGKIPAKFAQIPHALIDLSDAIANQLGHMSTGRLAAIPDLQHLCRLTKGETDGLAGRMNARRSGVTSLHPEEAVVSLLLPEDGFTDDAIQRFCHRIHFFASQDSAEQWMANRPGMFSIPVDKAFELGQLTNRLRLGTRFSETADPTLSLLDFVL